MSIERDKLYHPLETVYRRRLFGSFTKLRIQRTGSLRLVKKQMPWMNRVTPVLDPACGLPYQNRSFLGVDCLVWFIFNQPRFVMVIAGSCTIASLDSLKGHPQSNWSNMVRPVPLQANWPSQIEDWPRLAARCSSPSEHLEGLDSKQLAQVWA